MCSLGLNALQTANLRSNPRALNKRCGDMKDKSWYKVCWYKLYDVEMVAGLDKSLLCLSLLPFPSLLAPPAMTFGFLLFGSAQVITWLSSCSMWKRLMCDVDSKSIVTFLPSLRLSFVVVIDNCSYRVPSKTALFAFYVVFPCQEDDILTPCRYWSGPDCSSVSDEDCIKLFGLMDVNFFRELKELAWSWLIHMMVHCMHVCMYCMYVVQPHLLGCKLVFGRRWDCDTIKCVDLGLVAHQIVSSSLELRLNFYQSLLRCSW